MRIKHKSNPIKIIIVQFYFFILHTHIQKLRNHVHITHTIASINASFVIDVEQNVHRNMYYRKRGREEKKL